MLSRVIVFLGLAVTSAAAADPPSYVVWPKGLPLRARIKKFSLNTTAGPSPIVRRAESSSPTVPGPSS
jgi:hypothetical protein